MGKFSFDVGPCNDVTVGKMAKVQLHASPKEPFQRYLVDRRHRLATLRPGCVVPWSIDMRSVMSGETNAFQCKRFLVWKILKFQSFVPLCPDWESVPVANVLNRIII